MAFSKEEIEVMEALLNNQKKAIKRLKNIERNFEKDSASRKNREYLKKKIGELESWWKDFNECNS